MEATADGDFTQVERKQPLGIVEGEHDLGHPVSRTGGGAGEDDLFHFVGSEMLGRLGTEHPGDGVDHV